MADWVKIALKTGLVLGIMTALWAIFTQIPIPTLNYTNVFRNWSNAYGLICYWIPDFPIVWNFTLTLIGVLLALWVYRFGSIAVRWLFKVNE